MRLDIEVLRIVSAFGVVWFHSEVAGAAIAYSGLIIFLLLSVAMAGSSGAEGGDRAPRMAGRFLVPWAVWTAVYGVINVASGRPFISLDNGVVAGILTGPSVHLWYLPYVFAVLMVLDAAQRLSSAPTLARCGGCLGMIASLTYPMWRTASLQLGYPWAQYAHATVAVFAGMFIRYYHAERRWVRFPMLVAIVLSMVWTSRLATYGISFAIGTCAVSYLLLFRVSEPRLQDAFRPSQRMLGVYLVHPLLLGVANRAGVPRTALLPIGVFLCSWLLVSLLAAVAPRSSRYAV